MTVIYDERIDQTMKGRSIHFAINIIGKIENSRVHSLAANLIGKSSRPISNIKYIFSSQN